MSMSGNEAMYDTDSVNYDRGTGRSNFVAYLLGGVAIAVGLLGFLFYDDARLGGRDVTTTGSVLPRVESSVNPGTVTVPTSPNPAR